jgi:hypothetical protein
VANLENAAQSKSILLCARADAEPFSPSMESNMNNGTMHTVMILHTGNHITWCVPSKSHMHARTHARTHNQPTNQKVMHLRQTVVSNEKQ